MQGRRIEEDIDPAHQRQERPHREPEAVEERQAVEEPVAVGEIGDGQHLADVGEDVAVRQLDALGHAFGAARENNHGRGAGGWRMADGRWQMENVPEQGEEFPGAGDAGAHIFEINQTDARFHKIVRVDFGALKKGARGDDVLQSGQFRARQHGGSARGEVQHGGHFAQAPQGEDGDRCGVDIGHQQANPPAARNPAAQGVRQHIRSHHQFPIGQLLHRRIFEDDVAGMFDGQSPRPLRGHSARRTPSRPRTAAAPSGRAASWSAVSARGRC